MPEAIKGLESLINNMECKYIYSIKCCLWSKTKIGGLSLCAGLGNTECERKEKIVASMFYIAKSVTTRWLWGNIRNVN